MNISFSTSRLGEVPKGPIIQSIVIIKCNYHSKAWESKSMMSLSRQDFLFHYCLVIDLSNCSATGEESLALILFQRHKQTFFAAFATLKKENVCGRDHKGKRVGQTFWDTVHRNRPRKNGKSSVSVSGKKNPQLELLLFLGSYPTTRRSTNLDF